MSAPSELLENPPNNLAFCNVRLRFSRIVPGDARDDFVPYYHFRILTLDDTDVGHINFRVGDTEHVRCLPDTSASKSARRFEAAGWLAGLPRDRFICPHVIRRCNHHLRPRQLRVDSNH